MTGFYANARGDVLLEDLQRTALLQRGSKPWRTRITVADCDAKLNPLPTFCGNLVQLTGR